MGKSECSDDGLVDSEQHDPCYSRPRVPNLGVSRTSMGVTSKGSSTSQGDTREYGDHHGCRGCYS